MSGLWRSILAALATARLATRLRAAARSAFIALIAAGALVIATAFAAFAGYHYLAAFNSPAFAAAIVAAVLAVIASGLLFLSLALGTSRDTPGSSSQIARATGFDGGDVRHLAQQAERTVRHIGPLKVSLVAFAVGFLLARR